MSKCIICGRELTSGESPEMYNNMCLKCYQEQKQINQLKQQLEEKEDECNLYKKFADGGAIDLVIESVGRLREIDQLKQQLEEKDKEINSLIVDYEKRISQEQELMSNMEHRLAEKQNEIDEINKEFVQAVHDWKALCAEKDKEISKLQASYQQLETDRDTWQKACELASSRVSWCPAKQGECDCAKENRNCTNYFYQQAKKELTNE